MSEQTGQKTEQPTPRRMEEALKQGQIARSPEVQTVFVLLAGLGALMFVGQEIWQGLVGASVATLGHLHDITVSSDALPAYAITATLLLLKCAGPIVLATLLGGLL